MAVLVRIAMIILAYVLACIAASLILTIGTLTPEWDDLTALGLQSVAVWAVVMVGAAVIGGIAMMPALLVIALTEGFSWRSSLIYAALGGVLALSLSYGLDFAGYNGDPGSPLVREREVLAAAGIAGGFVYWLFAGRKAGSWKWFALPRHRDGRHEADPPYYRADHRRRGGRRVRRLAAARPCRVHAVLRPEDPRLSAQRASVIAI